MIIEGKIVWSFIKLYVYWSGEFESMLWWRHWGRPDPLPLLISGSSIPRLTLSPILRVPTHARFDFFRKFTHVYGNFKAVEPPQKARSELSHKGCLWMVKPKKFDMREHFNLTFSQSCCSFAAKKTTALTAWKVQNTGHQCRSLVFYY